MLWASTSTKNAAYPELLYVESLIGPDTVDTIPPATYEAFKAHGTARAALTEGVDEARGVLAALAGEGSHSGGHSGAAGRGRGEVRAGVLELLASIEQSLSGPSELRAGELTRSLPTDRGARASHDRRLGEHGKVGRLWAHDQTLWTGADEANWLGWLGVAMDQLAHAHRFTALVEDIRSAGFKDAVLLGMGGSSLCPEVLSSTFASQTAALPRLRVLDSTDPQQIKTLEDELDLEKTLFFVSSKSGTTLEPNIFAAYFYARVTELVGAEEAGRRFIAITDPGSPLEKLAERGGYRAVFHGLPSIGGRYSALSDFGMMPGAACGVDVCSLLDSAERMAHACAACVPAGDNPGLVLGAMLGTGDRGRDKLTLVASSAIRDFGAWLEQLLAESTGKQGRGVIPVDREPVGEPDIYGQTAVRLPAAGIRARRCADAKVEALEDAGHPVVRIPVHSVCHLGDEFFRWEIATAVAGSIIGIDPFDQPDVEDAKVAARELTDAYERTGWLPDLEPFYEGEGFGLFADKRNAKEIRQAAHQDGSFDGFLAADLSRVEPGDYAALLAYVPMTCQRVAVARDPGADPRPPRVATCVGFGPRFGTRPGRYTKAAPTPVCSCRSPATTASSCRSPVTATRSERSRRPRREPTSTCSPSAIAARCASTWRSTPPRA